MELKCIKNAIYQDKKSNDHKKICFTKGKIYTGKTFHNYFITIDDMGEEHYLILNHKRREKWFRKHFDYVT